MFDLTSQITDVVWNKVIYTRNLQFQAIAEAKIAFDTPICLAFAVIGNALDYTKKSGACYYTMEYINCSTVLIKSSSQPAPIFGVVIFPHNNSLKPQFLSFLCTQ